MEPIKGYDAWKLSGPPETFVCPECDRTHPESFLAPDAEMCLDCSGGIEDEDGVDGPFEERLRR
jgi:hypothetical protein